MHLAMWPLFKLVMLLLRSIPAFFRSRNDQAIVEVALRQQLATYALKGPKPRITSVDRTFWVFLSRIWSGWKENLVIVQPDTVVRWHRKGFRLYWRSISKRGPGRPPIPLEIQALIADSERSGPGIPKHVGHPFRLKWATHSEACGPGIPRKRSCHSDMWATLGE